VKLYMTTNSPYTRKVRVLVRELGLERSVEEIPTDPRDPSSGFWDVNPLGKVPTLETDQGNAIFDSDAICGYLDQKFGDNRYMPPPVADDGQRRTRLALAHGLIDVSMVARLEKQRQDGPPSEAIVNKNLAAVERGLAAFERSPDSDSTPLDMVGITLVCALEWIQFRHPERDWLAAKPRLAQWVARLSQRPSFAETKPA